MIRWNSALNLVALLLIPAVALFFVWAARRRRRALDAFVAASLLPAVVPDLDVRRRRARAGLRIGALLLMIVALAGPMWGFRWEEVRREGIDLVVALDTSRSMLANDVKPNRLARAKLAVRDLLTQLDGDRVALVAFAGTAFVQCPLTLDYAAFGESLDAIEVGIIPKGGTAISAAIDAALEAFEGRQGKHQAMILITDGEDHEGKVEDSIKHASERGVKVFTIGLGTPEGELIPGESGGFLKDRSGQVVKSRLDEETLKKVAVDTGGVYMHAGGTSFGLAELYRDYIGTMEKRELASTLERRWEHRFQLPLALALLLLIAEPLVGDRRVARRRWFRRRSAATAAAQATASATRPGTRAAGASTAASVAAILLAVTSLGWTLDPHATAREASRLYNEGKFDDAVTKYNQALTDDPDSAILHFNLGNAAYKQGKLEDAVAAYTQVPTADDAQRTANVAYNLGNAKYRMAAAAEGSKPQDAMKLYAEALVAYRRAMGAAPNDADPKFNYELTMRKLEELKKKLEEQQQQQQQQAKDQQQQDQQQDQDQQNQDQQQKQDQQQQQAGGEQKDEQQPEQKPDEQQQQQAGEQQPQQDQAQQQQQQQQQQAGQEHAPEQRAATGDQPPPSQQQPENPTAAAGGEKREGEMSPQEATALLDAQRDDEVQPEQVMKRLQGPAAVAEPAQDW